MSDLEEAAAAFARRQLQAAESEATRNAEAERAEQQDAALLRERAREFFVFAHGHGASLMRRYDAHASRHSVGDYRYTRTGEMCVAAAAFSRIGTRGLGWAVTSDGKIYQGASACQRGDVRNAWRKGIRDNVFVAVDTHRHQKYGHSSYTRMNPAFVAAAAALLTPVSVSPHFPKVVTGVQPDGSIGYMV
ncbi:hypothetical protein ACGFZS_48240 [Streptomyces sp. NPDC048288]|uniref:hypothetical protein n=1 Tax=Streptomyces sp. NPDC048288 TaxID=3365529 RepID=UPI003710BA3E